MNIFLPSATTPFLESKTVPVWSGPSNSAAGSFRDEDIFADDARSHASSGGIISNQGSSIVGTFRPPLEDMVKVNVSSHGKNFPDSSSDGLFRKRTDNGIRRSSDFALSAEDMEYDAVGMTKRRYFTGTCGLMVVLAIITIAVVAIVSKLKSGSFPALLASNPFPTPGGPIVDSTLSESDCDFDNIPEPDAFLQCRCTGHISTYAEGVLVRYNDLRTNFVTQNVFPNFNCKMDSCDPPNLALVWLAADEYPQTEEMFDRYMLALMYAAWKGYEWTRQDNWLLTTESHCECVNGLTLSIPTELGLLKNLKSLEVDHNNLAGRIPTEIFRISNLDFVDLSSNNLSGTIPTEIGSAITCREFRIQSNTLTGSIPTQVGDMDGLTVWASSGNRGDGAIPTEFGKLVNLVTLDLSDMGLSGSIITEFGLLKALLTLSLGGNYIGGPIPTELGAMEAMQSLLLNQNALVGGIPSEISQLPELTDLYLQDNNLTGEVPGALAACGRLSYVDFSGNELQGQMPDEICSLRQVRLKTMISNCAIQCSIPSCCSSCSP
ncbi:hypothetical protein MHU86_12741 [Fragilaria crotonensis]|nr:hypothetical protein MHU86_12741 [Fragilaria crotonensis]